MPLSFEETAHGEVFFYQQAEKQLESGSELEISQK